MFGTIRKHQTWLWSFLIVVMSLSLVALFTSADFLEKGSGGGSRRGDYNLGSFDGRPVDQGQFVNAIKELRLSTWLHTGRWPTEDQESKTRLEGEALQRVFLLHKLKEMDIEASEKAVGLIQMEQLRDFSFASLDKEILQPNGLTLSDYDRYVRNEAAIRQLVAAVTVSARLATPAEAQALWQKQNQPAAGQIAPFWSSNYLSKVTITNGAIPGFYTNRLVDYTLKERVAVSYLNFPASNFLAQADTRLAQETNLNEIISELYSRGKGGTNAWTDTNGAPLAEAAAKAKIREQLRTNEALRAARRAAAEFGTELLNQPEPNKPGNLEKLAAAKGLQVKITKPFEQTQGPEELQNEEEPRLPNDEASHETFLERFRRSAFELNPGRPILFNPLLGRSGIYLIAFNARLPREAQPFEKVQEKVAEDYKKFMSYLLARAAAATFRTNLTNGLAMKKSFSEICAAEKVPVMDLPLFTPESESLTNLDSRIPLNTLHAMARGLDVGQASIVLPAQPQNEGAYVFYFKDRPAADAAKMKEELPEFLGRVRAMRQSEAFREWFGRQAELARLTGPKKEPSTRQAN